MEYTPEEIQEIQDMIAGKVKPSEEDTDRLISLLQTMEIPNYAFPFVPLLLTDPPLYDKVLKDPVAQELTMYGFFPATLDISHGRSPRPRLSIFQGTRGYVGIVQHPEKSVVIKAFQSSREQEISQIASDLGMGPKQYPSLGKYMTEEFVDGTQFCRLPEDQTGSQNMYALGKRMGTILRELHSRDILYGDIMIDDDFGKSHLIVPQKEPAKLFDYGVALKIDNHADWSDEELFDFVRTLPGINISIGIQLHNFPLEEVRQMVVQAYRPELTGWTKDDIKQRDIEFLSQGLSIATIRLGSHIIEYFRIGLNETYPYSQI